MTTYRLSATGKLHHLIQLCQDRISTIATASRQPLQNYYDLKPATTEMMKSMGVSTMEFGQQNILEFKTKIILDKGVGYLMGISHASWEDPENQELMKEWREVKIILITTTNQSATVPPRFAGVMSLKLNTAYVSKGIKLNGEDFTWFRYIKNMPDWAKEKVTVINAGARWIDQEAFENIKDRAIRTEKEIRLADKKGQNEGDPRGIFYEKEEEKVLLCHYDEKERMFKTRSLAEVKRKFDPQKEEKTNEPDNADYEHTNSERENYDRTKFEHRNPREQNEPFQTNLGNGRNNMQPFEHRIPMKSYVQTNNADQREQNEPFVTNLGNVRGNMQRMKIGAPHGPIVPPECAGEIRSRQTAAHIQGVPSVPGVPGVFGRDHVGPGVPGVPQPRGQFKESREKEMLLNTEIPNHIGVNDALLMPRSPLQSKAIWPDHPRPGEDVFIEKERSRLQEFQVKTGRKTVTFGQAAQRRHDAEFEEENTDPSAEHTYEEIHENSDTDMSTPRSRLAAQVTVRQRIPHKIVLNYEMQLPRAFNFPPPNPSHFNFKQAPAPLSIRRQVPIEDPVFDISDSEEERWERWENDNDEEELEWSIRNYLGPRSPTLAQEKEQGSHEKDRDDLKELIDREVQVVHELEQRINNSEILEGIYAENTCTLLNHPQITCAYTNPDLLSNNQKEKIEIMKNIYEKIRKAKEDRVTVLERLEEAETLRRSKRLLTKPKRRYDHC